MKKVSFIVKINKVKGKEYKSQGLLTLVDGSIKFHVKGNKHVK